MNELRAGEILKESYRRDTEHSTYAPLEDP
jgi:hypothetical protein